MSKGQGPELNPEMSWKVKKEIIFLISVFLVY